MKAEERIADYICGTSFVFAAGTLGMAIIVTGINQWYLAWMLIVAAFIAFMYSNRGRPSAA